jgi:hypothetical protein
MKMEQTECSEMSAHKIQTPGNYPEESIQQILTHIENCSSSTLGSGIQENRLMGSRRGFFFFPSWTSFRSVSMSSQSVKVTWNDTHVGSSVTFRKNSSTRTVVTFLSPPCPQAYFQVFELLVATRTRGTLSSLASLISFIWYLQKCKTECLLYFKSFF